MLEVDQGGYCYWNYSCCWRCGWGLLPRVPKWEGCRCGGVKDVTGNDVANDLNR